LEWGRGQLRTVEQGKLGSGRDLVFSAVFADENSVRIAKTVEQDSIPFGELFDNARGVEIGKSHPAISPFEGDVPFLIGSDISRYQTRGRHRLKLGHPDIPARDYKEPELYRGEKILIRKTGKGINATLDRDSYVIQVVYIFKPRQAGVDLCHILGILNSKLMAFYYFSKFGQKERGVFPHLTQNKVLQLPIRLVERAPSQISEMVSEILTEYRELSRLGGLRLDRKTGMQRRIAELEEQIDEGVFDLYGLDAKDREFVRASVGDGSRSDSAEVSDDA
jgi:hypothetical protein